MKMRFWLKTYILTLLLFLICLNVGIFALAYYTYSKSVDSYESTCSSEQFYIAKSFERDYAEVKINNGNASLLMISYGEYYAKQNINLAFLRDNEVLYSSFLDDQIISTVEQKNISKSIKQIRVNGSRYIYLSYTFGENADSFTMLYAKNISGFDSEWRSLIIIFTVTSFTISIVLAVSLYFVLKKLSAPLEQLRKTTDIIAAGDYNTKVEVVGQDEFSELAKSFNKMVEQINRQITTLELNAMQKQQLVDNLAHELRTPLTSIHGYAEYLQKAAVSEEERIDSAEYIINEAKRLQNISEKLLNTDFIRNNEITTEELSVRTLLNDAVKGLHFKAEQKLVKLINNAEDATILGDSVLLQALFSNLIDNAIKACVDNGIVEINTIIEDEKIAIIVADNGKGMTEEELKHITEPFYRNDNSRSRVEGGAGLGLALCKQITDSHNAIMKFSSEPRKGTVVTVYFTTS